MHHIFRRLLPALAGLILGLLPAAALAQEQGAAATGAQTPATGAVQTPADDAGAQSASRAAEGEGPHAGSPDALWDEANTAYMNGDFRRASEVYGALLSQGYTSAKLYYNLGNASFKEGRLGRAILFYNRALRLMPGSEDVRYNLEVAESMTKDEIDELPEFFATTWLRALRHTMGCTSWTVLSLVLLAVLLGALLLYLLARRLSLRKAGFYTTLGALLLFVMATWFAVLERREILNSSEAIVMAASSAVKSSPDNASTDLFLLHEGTRVTVSDTIDTWCEITLADGKKGWIERSKIEII